MFPNLNVGRCSHLFISPNVLCAHAELVVSKRCFVNTPRLQNLIPSCINSRITFSPSWLIVVMFFISITSSRPLRSALACWLAFLSSVASRVQ